MHNLYVNFVKILEIFKDFSKDLVNERGNLPRRGIVPRFPQLSKTNSRTFSRIIGKISAFTVLQYINYINKLPIGRV